MEIKGGEEIGGARERPLPCLMESPLVLWCFVVFLVLIRCNFYLCSGCVEKDRRGLLEVKASINYPNGSSLSSWEEGGGDCCNWEGVVCSSTSGRVQELDLSLKRDYELVDRSWYVNASVFAAFDELRRMDLSNNDIIGWQQNEGSGGISSLKKIEQLDLSFNALNTSILPSLASLKKLEVLDLSSNELAGAIPPSFGSFSLKALSLRDNQLNGSLPVLGLCRLKKLQELDLSGNELDGGIPSCLGSLTSLRLLDLSHNKFEGSFPSSIITNHTSLVFLAVSHNRLEGTFSLQWFANHTKLKVIDLTCDDVKLDIEADHPSWVPSFQLKIFYLSNCNLNRRYQGSIPNFLSTQYELKSLDLSHNRMSGNCPTWLLRNNTRLEYLNLMNNSMAGPFDLPSHLNTSIQFLDISNNHIYGHLPTNIGTLLPELWIFNMSRNHLQGSIPFSLGDVRGLRLLDLSNNNLIGEIPGNLTLLQVLRLDNNQFTEIIVSDGLSNTSSLTILDISNNQLSGSLPNWMGELPYLETLLLHGNHFQGPIPLSFCQMNELWLLDLSHSYLSGTIPSCFNLSNLRYLHLQGNELVGSISSGLLRSPKLVTLDIRYNNFQGLIPSWIGGLSKLRALLLRGNHFHGSIPLDYCQLNLLRILDLSYNNLSGSIPSCFNKINFTTTIVDDAFTEGGGGTSVDDDYLVDSVLHKYVYSRLEFDMIYDKQEVEFMAKSRSETYKGDVLRFMSGIDLSWNHLTGDIPPEIGNLINLHALNLSHNLLTGAIPKSFSNLRALESLDLSHNQLSGSIPSQLTELTSLEVFTVAHNNLSGRVPDFKAQFATFSESDYQGNLDLCGPPLKKSCTSTPSRSMTTPIDEEEDGSTDGLITSLPSFIASYTVFLLGFVIPLYLNLNWRARYFQAMDTYLLFPVRNCFIGIYDMIYIKIKRIWK